MKFKKTLGTILVALSIIGGCRRTKFVKYDYEYYKGQIDDYKVSINQQKLGKKLYTKLVHLDAVDSNTIPYGITGHDYDSDNKWDRIFIQETNHHGCNAMFFNEKGEARWEPCPADKDKVDPFTKKQVLETRKILNKAIKEVENEEHREK